MVAQMPGCIVENVCVSIVRRNIWFTLVFGVFP